MKNCNYTPLPNVCTTTTNDQCCVPSTTGHIGAHHACCPVEKNVHMWSATFCRAMTELQTDILKDKIKKIWGSQMDKMGDAVIKAMGIKWQGMLSTAQSQSDLRDTIKDIFLENP